MNKQENKKYANRKKKKISMDRINEYKKQQENRENTEYVYGINPVTELLDSNVDINKIWILSGERSVELEEILKKAKEQKVVVVYTDKNKLNNMALNNQGVVASVNPFKYSEVYEILEEAKNKNEDPFIVILDKVTDSQNLGAIVRSAEAAGVHGIIIPKRNSAQVTSATNKTSAGAISHIKIARVSNIVNTINELKNEDIWVIGTSLEAKDYHINTNLSGAIAIVIGNEEKGISRIVKENCDLLVKIPMIGKIESLNASVSTGILLYEVVRQKLQNRKKTISNNK